MSGLPIFGTSNYTYSHWESTPSTRGTWSIIQSCVLTLALCVYSAIHLNVFPPDMGIWSRWWRVKLKWVLVAMLMPEYIVFMAWNQRMQAGRVARALRKRAGQEECPSLWRRWERLLAGRRESGRSSIAAPRTSDIETGHIPPAPTWASKPQERFGLEHGFAIVMGALAVDMLTDPLRVWPLSCNRLTISSDAVIDLLGSDSFLDIDLSFITSEVIGARQKADGLARTLIIIQALWFCSQFLSRIITKMPVTLIELNTFAHAICALIVFLLWWQKPKDIEEPFLIKTETSEALRDLCAHVWTFCSAGKRYEGKESMANSVASSWKPMLLHDFNFDVYLQGYGGTASETVIASEGCGADLYLLDPRPEALHTIDKGGDTNQLIKDYWLSQYNVNLTQRQLSSTARHQIRTLGASTSGIQTTVLQAGERIPGTSMCIAPQFLTVELDAITLRRWSRAFSHGHTSLQNRLFGQQLVTRVFNFFIYFNGRMSTFPGHLLQVLPVLFGMDFIYSGLHILAWNSSVFNAEEVTSVLWKISCLLLIPAPITYAFMVAAEIVEDRGWNIGTRPHLFSFIVCMFAVTIAVMVISRLYLQMEVILVLPYADPRVYQEPVLGEYWPHF